MTDDSIIPILYRNETSRQLVQPGATTDDPIITILAILRSNLERRERERQEGRRSKLLTGEEQFERRLERLLNDPSATVRNIDDFHDELADALFRSGGKSISDYVEHALQAKIAQAQSAIAEPQRKNKGGRKATTNNIWAEIVRIAIVEGALPDRHELRGRILEWITENDPNGGPSESTIRGILQTLEETPDIDLSE